jgi:hypothetical protein
MHRWIVIFEWHNENEIVVVDAAAEQSAINKAHKALEAEAGTTTMFTQFSYKVAAWDVASLTAPAVLAYGGLS